MLALNTLKKTHAHSSSYIHRQTNWTRTKLWLIFFLCRVCFCLNYIFFFVRFVFCLICSNKIMCLPALNLIENTEKSQSSANDKRRTIIHGMRTQDERVNELNPIRSSTRGEWSQYTCCLLQIYIKLFVDYDLFHFECNRTQFSNEDNNNNSNANRMWFINECMALSCTATDDGDSLYYACTNESNALFSFFSSREYDRCVVHSVSSSNFFGFLSLLN